MDNLSSGIRKFDGQGYEVWSTLMESVLSVKKVKHVLTQAPPTDDNLRKLWDSNDETAKAIILLSLNEEMVSLVLACPDAKSVWNRLREVHAQRSESCKMNLEHEFYSLTMQPGQKVSSYVAAIELVARKLRDVGVAKTSDTLISKIVSGLSPEFQHFRSVWMGTPEAQRTYTNLLPRLMVEESMLAPKTKEDPAAFKASANGAQEAPRNNRKKKNKKDLECYHCHKLGHMKRECRTLKREQESGVAKKNYAIVATSRNSSNNRWFYDSGASFHMTSNREWFVDYKPLADPISIEVGNKEYIDAIGIGSIDVVSIVNGERLDVTLTDVHYVPKISSNLFSLGVADSKKIQAIASNGKLDLVRDGTTIIQGTKGASNMYTLNIHVHGRANIARAERSLEEWHRTLGHPDINEIKNLASKGCAKDFKIVEQTGSDRCGGCASGKAHHASHPESDRERSTVALHRVHTDLVGPIETPTINGARYFMLLRDEYSGFMYVYFMKAKSEVVDKLRSFIHEASVTAQCQVQILRSDNGSEFKNESVKLLCDTEGVIQEFSAPYTPQQNGEIERANRTILETARTILHGSGLPLFLWGEAVATAVYLRNRLTNKRNRDKTPFELFHGKAPQFSHMIEFGKELHLLDSRRGESKFQSKTIEAYMVGYGSRNRTYRCYNPRTQDIVISSDVIVASHREDTRLANVAERPEIALLTVETGTVDAGHPPGETSRTDQEVAAQQETVESGDANAIVLADQDGSPADQEVRTGDNESAPPAQVCEQPRQAQTTRQVASQAERSAPIRCPVLSQAPGISQVRSDSIPSNLRRTAAPLTIPGRGTLTTTRQTPTPFTRVSSLPMPVRQAARGQQASTRSLVQGSSGASSAQTMAATHGDPQGQATINCPQSGAGQLVAAGRNLNNRISPNFEWTLRDRAKRTTSSRYARMAKACYSEPSTYDEAINGEDGPKWRAAVDREIGSLMKNETWKVVPRGGEMREISCKWVFKVKTGPGGEIVCHKARLVARGFSQIQGIDYDDVYAPVVHIDSIRILFAICAQFNLEYAQFDVATAFLNGEVEEELYIKPPEGVDVPEGHTLRLLKSLYGLKQAPRCFNKKFREVLSELKMHQVCSDPCVFTSDNGEMIILSLYVDDGIIFANDRQLINNLLSGLKEKFDLKTITSNYFLGLEIVQDKKNSSIFLHQRAYAQHVLETFGFSDSKSVASPLEAGHVLNRPETLAEPIVDFPYAELIGKLNYLATRTRPDISYALSVLSKYNSQPRQQHVQAAKRVLRYLAGTSDVGLMYEPVADPYLQVYSDADYAGDHANRRSTSGMVCFINTGPITYKAQQQQRATLSTTEAEYIACAIAVKEIIWITTFLKELKIKIDPDVVLWCDNQSAIRLIKNSELHQRSKHIDIRHHFIREYYEDGLFATEYVQTDQNRADLFTKALTKAKHQYLCDEIGCISARSLSPGRVLE